MIQTDMDALYTAYSRGLDALCVSLSIPATSLLVPATGPPKGRPIVNQSLNQPDTTNSLASKFTSPAVVGVSAQYGARIVASSKHFSYYLVQLGMVGLIGRR